MKAFYTILANSLVAFLTNNLVWFAVTFWVYLETKSVVATSVMAGIYSGTVAISGFFLGSLVDRYRKKKAMTLSSISSVVLYAIALAIYSSTPTSVFTKPDSPALWVFIVIALLGAIVGNIRAIALSTLVTLLIPEEDRDKANGMVGTSNGVGFLVASIFSGLVIGFLGMFWMLVLAIALTGLVLIHLWFIQIPEKEIIHADGQTHHLDIRGTIRVLNESPGLFPLIFFNCFNNFLGGVFMALMDAYGLSLVSVQEWGTLWGFLSTGFIIGGLVVSRWGLGTQPVRMLMLINVVMWIIAALFTIHPAIVLLTAGLFGYLCLIPVVEAAEQTILQTLVPPERQGRVFGFAQSIEEAASPVTAFMIGPIAQYIFIPFMTTGAGVELIGGWFGTGNDRGLALLFTVTGVIGLVVTLMAIGSKAYRQLSESYRQKTRETISAMPTTLKD